MADINNPSNNKETTVNTIKITTIIIGCKFFIKPSEYISNFLKTLTRIVGYNYKTKS